MTMPQFTAEASLRTRGQYRTGVQVNNTNKNDWPDLPGEEMEEEIEVHSCAPGWTDIGGPAGQIP